MLIRKILSAKGREVVVTRQEETIAEVVGLQGQGYRCGGGDR
jgi:antitoxin (DNA-binding transcriptional repressor) of toxin-antitoxin stability system